MKTTGKNYLKTFMAAFIMLSCLVPQVMKAASGAADRSKAYGYQFTQDELNKYPQKTNLPTVYLNVYKTTYDSSTNTSSLTGGVQTLESLQTVFGTKNDWYYICNIVIRDDHGTIEERNETVNMRGRGNATWDIGNSMKKPMRLKFPAKTKLLGDEFANAKNWVLLANFYDKSLIKNGLDYELGKYMNLPFSPAAKYVDLVVNGKYMGTYQISDKVEVGDKRIPGTKEAVWLEANSAKRTGFAEEPCFYTWEMGSALCVNIKNPEVENTSISNNVFADETLEKIRKDAMNLLTAVKSFDKNSNTTYRKYIDFSTAVDHFIALDITGNYDGDVANNYMYKEQSDRKYKFGPIWDSDLAWGSNQGMKEKHFWEGELYGFGAACKKIYESDPYFVKLLYERWVEVYGNGKLITYLNGKVDELATSISQSAALNYSPVSSGGAGCGIASEASWADGNSYTKLSDTYTVIKNFNIAHISWLNTQYKAMYDRLGCATFEMPNIDDEDDPEEGEGAAGGLQYLGKGALWGGSEQVYSYTGNASSMCVGAKMTVELEGAGARMEVFADNQYSSWVATWGGSPLTYTRTLSSDDVARLKNASYTIKIAVYEGGTCKSVKFEGGAVCSHTYSNDHATWTADANGIFHRVCTLCGAEEKGVNYYEFTVYPESETTQTVYATSWTPSSAKPNSIAVVKIKSGLETDIPGYNIINSTKNAAGDQTCADFRLTDGHPYYSANKFKAAKATYTRLLGTNEEYGTMILPYKYQQASTDEADFYHLATAENGKLTLTAIDPSIEGNASAYTPVVFKRKAGATSITINGTDITVKKSSATKWHETLEGWKLNGVVESQTVTADTLYQISDARTGVVSKVNRVAVVPFRAYFSNTTGATSSFTLSCPSMIASGDVNGDGKLDINDLVFLIRYLNEDTIVINASAADLDNSGTIAKDDIQQLVDKILEK